MVLASPSATILVCLSCLVIGLSGLATDLAGEDLRGDLDALGALRLSGSGASCDAPLVVTISRDEGEGIQQNSGLFSVRAVTRRVSCIVWEVVKEIKIAVEQRVERALEISTKESIPESLAIRRWLS